MLLHVRDSAEKPGWNETSASRGFFGHPRGLGYLAFAEAWERFSYYGMQSLLVLYMVQTLLLPGSVERIAGFATFQDYVFKIYGPLTVSALASVIFGFFSGGVYLTPILGGYLADRVLGRTRTIIVGAVLMTFGHLLMAFEATFLVALACLILGVGLFKGNCASQIGELYEIGDRRRADAFQIYVLGISMSAILSPLVCGTLGQTVAWHWGFTAAGVGMILGLTVYLSGLKWLPRDIDPSPAPASTNASPSRVEIRSMVLTALLLPALVLASIGNQQIFNAYMIWGNDNYDLVFFGSSMPVTWLVSLDAFIGTATILGSIAFWRWVSTRWRAPSDLTKLTVGASIAVLGPLLLAFASAQAGSTGQKIGLGWAIAFHLINNLGYSNIYSVGLSMFSEGVPRSSAGLMMGIFYLHVFVTNMVVGRLGGFLEVLGPVEFWLLHAALVAGGAALLLLINLLTRHLKTRFKDGSPAGQSA